MSCTKIPKFRRFVLQNFPFIEQDFDALTDYELICKVVEYLNKVIDQINTNTEAFQALQNYVANYFNNLDVQEEINNKLDAMVEDGTFTALIENVVLSGEGQVKYYFPNETGITSHYTIITAYGKNILYDTGDDREYTNLTVNLSKLGITHFDYVIVSHFHQDHAGNFISLINDGYIDENTAIYLPTYDTVTWASDSSYPYYTAIMAKLAEVGYEYTNPTEGLKVVLNDNTSFEFYNTDDTYYVRNNINSGYNNASLMLLFRHFGINTLLVSDAYNYAVEKIYNDGVLPDTIHLYQTTHHGITQRNNNDYYVRYHFTIENIVQIVGINDISTGKCSGGGVVNADTVLTENTFVTGYNKEMIEFSSYVNSMNLVNGYKCSTDRLNYTNQTLYVDVTTASEVQDGTSEHPFKNISQCLGFCQRNKAVNYTINVADGTYELFSGYTFYRPSICNTNGSVEIIGESKAGVIIEGGFNIYNASDVKLSKMTIISENVGSSVPRRNLDIKNSNVYVHDCIFTNASDQRCVYAENSKLKLTDCTFTSGSYGVYEDNSNVTLVNNTYTSIAQFAIYGIGGVFENITNNTVTDASILYGRSSDIFPAFPNGFEIFNGNASYADTNHQFTTIAHGGKFQRIKVYYTLKGSRRCREYAMNTSTNTAKIGIGDNFISSSDNKLFNYYAEITFANNNTATIGTARRCEITTAGVVTITDGDTSITVNSVVAY